jgi:osmotically-inducible protein OsmY
MTPRNGRVAIRPLHEAEPVERNEWALLEQVTRELDLDPILDLSDVDVAIDGRRVILIGSVPGIATKVRIEQAVARIDGVAGVVNELVVGARAP